MLHESRRFERPLLHAVLLVGVFFACLVPTIGLLEFSGGMENVTVATAREMVARDDVDAWLIPPLNGKPRLAKPPVVHWLTAAGLKSSSYIAPWLQRVGLGEQAAEFGARWPSLLIACFTLVAVYALGRVLSDWRLGLVGAFICGSTFLFVKYSGSAQYDIHLALWVTLTNVFLAGVIFHGRWLSGCAGAGVCLGLALMSKGPVAVVQTLVPVAAFVGWCALQRDRSLRSQQDSTPVGRRVAAVGLGMLLLAAVSLPWVWYVTAHVREVWNVWKTESTVGVEAGYEKRSKPYDYLIQAWYLYPWIIWFFIGLWFVVRERTTEAGRRLFLSVFLVAVPVVIMSFFAVRRNRYLLPMLGPVALIAARGLLEHMRLWRYRRGRDKLVVAIHWILVGMLVAFPVFGAWKLKSIDGTGGGHWYTWSEATVYAGILGALLLIGILLHLRWSGGMLAGTVAVLLAWQFVFVLGYRHSDDAQTCKRWAQELIAAHPDALVYHGHPHPTKDAPLEMNIYLNRPVRRAKLAGSGSGRHYEMGRSDRPQLVLVPGGPQYKRSVGRLPAQCRRVSTCKLASGTWYAHLLPANVTPKFRKPSPATRAGTTQPARPSPAGVSGQP